MDVFPPDPSGPGLPAREEIERLYAEALERPAGERAAFVESACPERPELRAEVLSLLEHGPAADRFFARLRSWLTSPLQLPDDAEDGSPEDPIPWSPVPARAAGSMAGRYRLLEPIGAGGMGAVYRAHDPDLDREVALKFLPRHLSLDGEARERFLVEARAAAALDHPHICTIHEIGATEEGHPFLAMALYRGETLKERLARGPVPPEEAVEIAVHVADALAAAHEHGILHRDVKPGNVMLTEEGAVKLLDFGLARMDDVTLTTPGLTPGTVAYMAPERVRGEDSDGRSDLWSLGVVLYEMLAGRRPFRGHGDRAVFHAILHEEHEPLRRLRPELPAWLGRVVHRLLRKDREERYGSARELLTELRRGGTGADSGEEGGLETAAATEAAVAASTGAGNASPRLRGGTRRRAALLSVLAVGLAALVGLTVSSTRGGGGTELDERVVAVLPFRVAGAEASLSYLREGMVDLLAAKLSGEAGPRTVDPRTLIDAWSLTAGGGADLPREEALDLARDLGAGRLVLGEVASLPGWVLLTASLHDVVSGRAEAPVSVEGPLDSLPSLVDRLVGGLLSVEAGEAERLASLTTSSLPALRLYLEGQAAFRGGRHDEAVERFTRAVQIDSTFALAALMTHSAAVRVRTTAPVGLAHAWRHRDRLGVRDREFLEFRLGPNYPEFSSRAEILASREELVRRQPDRAEAWFALADWTPHGLMFQGLPDSVVMRRTVEAFGRALALDSTFLPALEQLWFTARFMGDTADARRYGDLYLGRVPTGLQAETIRCLRAPGFPGPGALPEILARTDSVGGALIARCIWWLHFLPEASALRDAMAEHLRRRMHDPRILHPARRGILHMVASDRGRPAEAAEWDDALRRAGQIEPLTQLANRVRDGLHWDGDAEAAGRAAATLEGILAGPRPDSPPGPTAEAHCVLGQWSLAHGEAPEATPFIQRLRDLDGVGDSFGEVDAMHCAELLDTWQAARMGAPDTPDRIARLRSSLADRTMAGRHVRETALVLAELLEEQGDREGALDVLRGSRYVFPPLYNSTFLRERGRLASLLGDTTAAIDSYRRYLAMRTDPEPPLRPQVRRVASELERLTGARSP